MFEKWWKKRTGDNDSSIPVLPESMVNKIRDSAAQPGRWGVANVTFMAQIVSRGTGTRPSAPQRTACTVHRSGLNQRCVPPLRAKQLRSLRGTAATRPPCVALALLS